MEVKIIKIWLRYLLKKLCFFLLGLISFIMDKINSLRKRKREKLNEEKPSSMKQDELKRKQIDSTPLEIGSYWLTRIVFVRFLGFIYFFAFLIAAHQNKQLLGKDGLLPTDKYLQQIENHFGSRGWETFLRVPTVFLFCDWSKIDIYLDVLAYSGMVLAGFMMISGCANMIILFALWVIYHSITNIGQRWYSFGWESQLLETGFLAIFMCPVLKLQKVPLHTPTPWVVIYGYRWLIFRIMLGAGLIKIRGDRCWRDLTSAVNTTETLEQSQSQGELDFSITDQEVYEVLSNLKKHKAPGPDNIPNELLITGKEALKGHLTVIFNKILDNGKFPSSWNLGYIVPLHKKDDPTKAENYRGITLLSAIGKVFTAILNKRLYDYLTTNNIIKQEQGGFRKKHGTTDSIFILKSVIDKYVKSKPRKKNNFLFSCFVDFQKAFDCIPRKKLMAKLENVGINGNFLRVIQSMYSTDQSAIKVNGHISPTFSCYMGVKQGCMLSPTLFNLYLHDLPDSLNSCNNNDVMLNGKPISTLLYADDLVLFSKSAKGLQKYLDKLEAFCEQSGLTVNITKTKVMVFNNTGKTMNNFQFYLNKSKLENVKSYKYLGLNFTTFGNFTFAKQELKKAALKALFQMKKQMGEFFTSNIKLTIKLFDSLVTPILLYASEIWGIETLSTKDQEPMELVHLKFCKMLLKVTKNASNLACRAELGRFPLKCKACSRSFKFWHKIIKSEIHLKKLSAEVYQDIKNETKKAFWSIKIKTTLEQLGLGIIWMKQNELSPRWYEYGKIITQRIYDIERQILWSNLHNDERKDDRHKNKLRVFRQFKTDYNFEEYLSQVTNIKHRVALTKLRISNHKLEVETGRYKRPYLIYDERICPVCKSGVENEKHFLVWCPLYDSHRNDLREFIEKNTSINFNNMSADSRFMFLINSKSASLQRAISAYIHQCMLIRENELRKLPNT